MGDYGEQAVEEEHKKFEKYKVWRPDYFDAGEVARSVRAVNAATCCRQRLCWAKRHCSSCRNARRTGSTSARASVVVQCWLGTFNKPIRYNTGLVSKTVSRILRHMYLLALDGRNMAMKIKRLELTFPAYRFQKMKKGEI